MQDTPGESGPLDPRVGDHRLGGHGGGDGQDGQEECSDGHGDSVRAAIVVTPP